MKKSNELVILKNKFLTYIESEQGRGTKTIENYNRYLSCFLRHADSTKPEDITKQSVIKFKHYLQGKNKNNTASETKIKGLSEKTQNYHLTALRMFLRYLQKQGIASLDPKVVKLLIAKDCLFETLTDDELERLLQMSTANDIISLRDQAILLSIISTGVKVKELCALNKTAVLTKGSTVVGIGENTREVQFSKKAKETLRRYIDARKDTDEALFVNSSKRVSDEGSLRLTPRSVQRIVRRCTVRAGITKHITPQSLRNTYALEMYKKSADIATLQKDLGYLHTSSAIQYSKRCSRHV